VPADVPILDFDTETPQRTPMKINGKVYEIKRMGDYGIEEQHVIAAHSSEFDTLWATRPEDLKKKEQQRMIYLLDELAGKATFAPAEVIALLNAEQKKDVIQVFISRPLQNLQRTIGTVVTQMVEGAMEARNGSTLET
jgi:hypothetical protein